MQGQSRVEALRMQQHVDVHTRLWSTSACARGLQCAAALMKHDTGIATAAGTGQTTGSATASIRASARCQTRDLPEPSQMFHRRHVVPLARHHVCETGKGIAVRAVECCCRVHASRTGLRCRLLTALPSWNQEALAKKACATFNVSVSRGPFSACHSVASWFKSRCPCQTLPIFVR